VWKFKTVPRRFWKEEKNQRMFFDWLGKHLGFTSMEDWYNLTLGDLEKYGYGLLNYYNNSPTTALQSVYPHFDWQLWKFSRIPKRIWKDRTKDKEYMQHLSNTLGISEMDDWYRVSWSDLLKCKAVLFVKERGGLLQLLSEVYSDHKWKGQRLVYKRKKSSQWRLLKIIKELLPSTTEVIEDFCHSTLHFSSGKLW